MAYVLLLIALAGWLGGLSLFAYPMVRRRGSTLPSAARGIGLTEGGDLCRAPAVSVVIPARNEARRIVQVLRALSGQSVPPVEVIVVDDESSDETAIVASSLGARVVPTPPRPDGWLGKSWACQCGADEAVGDTLLFLDADVWLDADAIERLIAARELSPGVVSVQPYHRIERPYETLSAMFNAQVVASIGIGSNPRGLFGPCIMMGTDDYRRCGGHAAIKGSIVDDIALGRACRSVGIPLRTYLGGRTVRFRMYPEGPGQMLSGWAKNYLQGADATPRPILFAQSMWIVGAATVAVQTAFVSAGLPIGIVPLPAAIGAYAAYAGLLAASLPRYGRFGIATALLFPIHLAFFGCVTAYALWVRVRGGTVNWRGRAVVPHPRSVTVEAGPSQQSGIA